MTDYVMPRYHSVSHVPPSFFSKVFIFFYWLIDTWPTQQVYMCSQYGAMQ